MIVEDKREINMLSTPNDWPVWPVLPLTRTCRDMRNRPLPKEYGFMINHPDSYSPGKYVVYLGLMFQPSTASRTYDSLEEIFKAGWRVD